MSRYDTAAQIINDALAEFGLASVVDPFASADAAVQQMCVLLNTAGRELVLLHDWQVLFQDHTFNTTTDLLPGTTNEYDLPDDFSSMLNQTYWSPTTRFPLGGPLSPQDWAYLVNTNLASSTIYVSFREFQNKIVLLPDPPPANTDIYFQYRSRSWVALLGDFTDRSDRATDPTDVILFEAILMVKFLKLRFMEAKGFDTTAALGQFNAAWMSCTGLQATAPILSLSRNRIFPYLDYRNVPETNYGIP